MQSFTNLAQAVNTAPPAALLNLLGVSVAELLGNIQKAPSNAKADRALIDPLRAAVQSIGDAKKAQTSYRTTCLQQARSSFLRSRRGEPELSNVQMDFYAGVCADLLSEREIAISDYEAAYKKCMAMDVALWSFGLNIAPGQDIDWGVFEWNYCSIARRSIISVLVAGLAALPAQKTSIPLSCWNGTFDPCAGATTEVTEGLNAVEGRTIGLNALYEVMRPIADVLVRRKSQLKGLVLSAMLKSGNVGYGARALRRMIDTSCRGELKYWH